MDNRTYTLTTTSAGVSDDVVFTVTIDVPDLEIIEDAKDKWQRDLQRHLRAMRVEDKKKGTSNISEINTAGKYAVKVSEITGRRASITKIAKKASVSELDDLISQLQEMKASKVGA